MVRPRAPHRVDIAEASFASPGLVFHTILLLPPYLCIATYFVVKNLSVMATALERLASRADQACGACKKQKRRCDRAVPECSLCRRTGRVCGYNDAPDPPPTPAAFAALQKRLSELEERLNTPPNNFGGDVSSPAASHHSLSDVSGAARNPGQSTVLPIMSTVPAQQELEFPAALFLDIDCFVWARLHIPDPLVGIPVVRSTPNACGMSRLILFHPLCKVLS